MLEKVLTKLTKCENINSHKVSFGLKLPFIQTKRGCDFVNETNKTPVRPRGTDSAKVVPVIVTEALRGIGTENDPVRIVKQYWSFDGELLAENDPV